MLIVEIVDLISIGLCNYYECCNYVDKDYGLLY